MEKERNVTRTVIESKTYNVYKMEGLTLVLLETIEEKGKVSEKDLAKKHNVDKVILDYTAEKKVTYGMTVTDFMASAKVIEEEPEAPQPETTNNESEVK
jgi:hypothetical protein